MQDQNITHIDLLRMDTQDSELMVLSGAEKSLHKIGLLYTEIILMPA